MLETYFATPALLWTLLAVPAALGFLVFAYIRRKQLAARLSSPLLLRRAVLVRPWLRRWKAYAVLAALALTALACAGPQWGLDPSAQFRHGRDVVVVLDLSRSMFAEQPSRRDLAVSALRQLADALEAHGGNRIALVAFAGQARLFFPFTNDCDHLRRTLDLIEADDYAKLSDKEPAFGTRIGAALTLAAQSCEPERTYRPVIVLLSDGDDPADDDEWLQGVDAARARGTPVHVVGFGNPAQPEPIVVGRDLLEYEGEVVRTRLNEPRLQKIAERTGGEFFPAHRQDKFPLGALLLNLMDANGPGEDEGAAGATLPIYQLRYVWFLLPALILFFGTMLLGDGQRAARGPMVGVKNKAPVLAILLAAIVTISAADPPALEALIGQADQAFAQGDFEAAISLYEKTEGLTEDPGRIAFNKAAAYYRLERYREAIECYRRTLEDDQAPPERRARACFDLGNAIVKQADGSAEQLAEAVAAYRAALHLAEGKASWRADARHNLELAQLLLNKARAENPEKVIPKAKPDKPKTDHEKNGGKGQKSVLVPVDPGQGFGQDNTAQGASGQKSEHLQTGAITVLPDSSTIMPRSPEDTLAALQQEARRIRDARRLQQNPPRPAHLTTKDW